LLRTISRKTGYDIDIHHEESLGLLRIMQKSSSLKLSFVGSLKLSPV